MTSFWELFLELNKGFYVWELFMELIKVTSVWEMFKGVFNLGTFWELFKRFQFGNYLKGPKFGNCFGKHLKGIFGNYFENDLKRLPFGKYLNVFISGTTVETVDFCLETTLGTI